MIYINKKQFKSYTVLMFVMVIVILAYGFSMPSDTKYLNCYWLNAFYLLLVSVAFGIPFVRGKFDLYDPITSFSVFFVLMFFIAPMRSVVLHDYYAYGIDMFPYAVKGSTYALIGYISFFFAYVFKKRGNSTTFRFERQRELINRRIPVSVFLITGILVTLFATLFYQVNSSGNSILYNLTFGLLGEGGVSSTTSDIGFIGFLSFALPSFILLYFEYGKSKKIAVVFLVIAFSLKITTGFRWNIIQMLVMFGSYYFIRTGKKIKIRAVLLILVLLMVPIFIMSMFRTGIRSGVGIDFSLINSEVFFEVLDDALWSNLDIYKSYYSLISVVPEHTAFLYGKQIIFYTMIILIPRGIWPGKPGNPGTAAQEIALGQAAVSGGYAYPCLGEYYYDSGLFGIVFYTGAFGYLAATLYNKYRYKAKTEMDLMVYCTILSQIIQFVTRGYMPTNFWRVVVAVLPYWLFKRYYYAKES